MIIAKAGGAKILANVSRYRFSTLRLLRGKIEGRSIAPDE